MEDPQVTLAACLASGAWHDGSTPEAPEKQKEGGHRHTGETEQICYIQRRSRGILAFEMLKSH